MENEDMLYEQAQEAVVPIGRTLNKPEMCKIASTMVEKALTVSDSLNAYVVGKQIEFIGKKVQELTKEKATSLVESKGSKILGAEVIVKRSPRKWEYEGIKYDTLIARLANAKKALDDYCGMLELAGEEGVVNQETGVAEYAKCISENGSQINVKL